jgi:prevent-host-death family protein
VEPAVAPYREGDALVFPMVNEPRRRGGIAGSFASCAGVSRAPPSPDVLLLCVMERVGVRELRQNLSVYLRRVRAGERLEVTERGEPVARLEPIVDASDPIARLELEGRIVRRATRDLATVEPLKLALERPLSDILDEMREDTV